MSAYGEAGLFSVSKKEEIIPVREVARATCGFVAAETIASPARAALQTFLLDIAHCSIVTSKTSNTR